MTILFGDMNVKTIIDLRTATEIAEKPDRIPEGVEYISILLLDDSVFGITHEEGQEEKINVPDMVELYRGLVTNEASVQGFKKVFDVDLAYIKAAFDVIYTNYGSVEQFLKG